MEKCVSETEKILNFSSEMGRQLSQNGAEIDRVEDSVQRLLRAYGCGKIDVFAIPTLIIITVQDGSRNYTKTIRSKTFGMNLSKLGQLNALCRKLCNEPQPVEEAEKKMKDILAEPNYPTWISYLGHGMAAGFFALFWGGCMGDAILAFLCGMLIKYTVGFLRKAGTNDFFTNLVTAMAAGLLAEIAAGIGLPVNIDKVIIGALMLLVPGIAMANTMRDMLSGALLTALLRMAELLIVGFGISVGVAMSFGIYNGLIALLL